MAVALSDRLERIHDGLAHQGAFSADSSAEDVVRESLKHLLS
jgi:hypothetical protein